MTRPVRFSTQLGGAASADEWAARTRRLESLGYAALLMPDHVVGERLWSAFPALTAAALATERLRVGTLVLANDFRHPLMLAREVATLDLLSRGRVELGLGAGWYERDYESLGLTFDRGRVRVERLAEAITFLKRLFREDAVTFAGRYYRADRATVGPRLGRGLPPLMIAGGGREILSLAGREADIVGIVAMFARDGSIRAHREVTAEGFAEKVRWVRDAAAGRDVELSMFLDVTLTDDPERSLRELAEQLKRAPELIADSVYRVVGTLDDVRDRIHRMRDEFGVAYFCLRGPHVDELGAIVGELAVAAQA